MNPDYPVGTVLEIVANLTYEYNDDSMLGALVQVVPPPAPYPQRGDEIWVKVIRSPSPATAGWETEGTPVMLYPDEVTAATLGMTQYPDDGLHD